ncbi:C4-dicarboxylate ABC transporter [Saccharospirillum sp. MSK14-1]|uniref:TRAP transporter substrate-binding protein n=1 Tax=Saccharospirillum sp. MSK14-1 TaxID=1897632 RepID=UPI000D3793A4|nr:TRAP transporter substrate-binding protein DctP [Saccharospirillum sp. MSK14-1]PTY37144.1 C4-dicarboxylate ABC transporter [Saccharospirillum sp. MSK14-1]
MTTAPVRNLIALALVSLTTLASATTLKISTQYPDGNAVLNELRRAGQAIESRTEGRVSVRFYPGGVMGDDQAVQRKIRIGQLHGALVQSGALANAYRDAQVLNAPLLFRNYQEVDVVRDEVDPIITAGLSDNGWKTFGLIEAGFAYGMSQNPILTLGDLEQQKLWLPANDPLSEQVARAFDINPIVLNIGDVLTGLQTGAIDAIVAPPVGAITLQWYSRLDYLTDAPFMYTYGVLALHERALRGVSDADLAVIDDEFATASQVIDSQTREDNRRALEALQQLGIEVLHPQAEDRQALERESTRATQRLIEEGQFSQQIFDRVEALLMQVRSES